MPFHPLSRYCSRPCQEAARVWRRWRAARRYRATPHGQQQRREQSRRYRERQRLRRTTEAAQPAAVVEEAAESREGQRDADFLQDFSGLPCRRPGCYELFQPQSHEPPQRFCCSACRQALHRVLQREARWRRRRRLIVVSGYRPPPRC